MRVLVCGGRTYGKNKDLSINQEQVNSLYRELDGLRANYPNITIIEGEAKGADTLARLWAEMYEIPILKFPANWEAYGKSAGTIRNTQMLDIGKPDLVLATDGGSGTINLIKQALKRKIQK